MRWVSGEWSVGYNNYKIKAFCEKAWREKRSFMAEARQLNWDGKMNEDKVKHNKPSKE